MKQEDTKQRILEKSLELFASKGYDAVSVGEIAKAVGVKAPSLYNHFASKQAIFDAIVESTAAHYEKDTGEISIHVQDVKQDFALFAHISEDALVEKVRQIFFYSLHDHTVSQFRQMMTLEQFRSPELAELYSRRYVDRMIDYHADIFRTLISLVFCGQKIPTRWRFNTSPRSLPFSAFVTASRNVRPNAWKSWTPM